VSDYEIMRCSICGTQIASFPEALEEGWCPCFYEGNDLHDMACLSCTDILLQYGEDDEFEVKREYRGKLHFLDSPEKDARQELIKIKAPVFDNEPWKLN
jgi:hypothetical protein